MVASDFDRHTDEGSVIDVAPVEPKVKEPPLYKVVLLNDNYTPQSFVVDLLQNLFHMDHRTATKVMLTIHTQGQGLCGVYPRDIAEMKVFKTRQYARQHHYPLQCRMEPE